MADPSRNFHGPQLRGSYNLSRVLRKTKMLTTFAFAQVSAQTAQFFYIPRGSPKRAVSRSALSQFSSYETIRRKRQLSLAHQCCAHFVYVAVAANSAVFGSICTLVMRGSGKCGCMYKLGKPPMFRSQNRLPAKLGQYAVGHLR